MRHFLLGSICATVLLAGPACEKLVDPSDNVTTEFPGTLALGEAAEHQLRATRSGEYSLRVKSLTPSQNTYLLLGVGIVDRGLCITQQQNAAGHNQFALAGEIRKDFTYCIQAVNPNVVAEPLSYVLDFSHPAVD